MRLNIEVIVAINTPAALAAKKATATVPNVVMRVADPVRLGLVVSLARPGGNVTGLSFMPDALGPKGVELLTQVLPTTRRMAALYQGNNPGAVVIIDEVERTAAQLGLQLVRLPVRDPKDYEHAFEPASDANAETLFVMDDGAITEHRWEILDLAAKRNLNVVYRRAGDYVDSAPLGNYITTIGLPSG